jgi:hypothetical protein
MTTRRRRAGSRVTGSGPRSELSVHRIEHPRGDGMGRAITIECRGSGLSALLADPKEVRALIAELQKALLWLNGEPARTSD